MISYGKYKTLQKAAFFLLIVLFFPNMYSQDVGDVEIQSVTISEWDIEAFINTSGGGAGFQYGWTPDHFNKHFFEINFLYNKHIKATRILSYISNRSYSFGKLYDLFFLRGGYGYQRILHHKPYWGGVEVRFTMSGGFSLGIGVPVFLKIQNTITGEISIEKYDPSKHDISEIYSRATFFKGISKTALRPGFYGKSGLRFDFSKKQLFIHVIDIGVSMDMVFPYIQQMAFISPKLFYFTAYIAYHFGKKKLYIDQ